MKYLFCLLAFSLSIISIKASAMDIQRKNSGARQKVKAEHFLPPSTIKVIDSPNALKHIDQLRNNLAAALGIDTLTASDKMALALFNQLLSQLVNGKNPSELLAGIEKIIDGVHKFRPSKQSNIGSYLGCIETTMRYCIDGIPAPNAKTIESSAPVLELTFKSQNILSEDDLLGLIRFLSRRATVFSEEAFFESSRSLSTLDWTEMIRQLKELSFSEDVDDSLLRREELRDK